MIIGGIASQLWGEPRFTRDIDITVTINPNDEINIIKKIWVFSICCC